MTSAHARGVQGARREAARRRAVEELLRARAHLVDVHASGRARRSSGSSQKFASRQHGARRQPRRVQGRAALRRDRRAVRAPVRDPAGAARAGHVPQHHRQPRGRLRAHRRRRSRRSCRSSTRRTRSRRRPTSSTSCRSTRTSACARCRPKTRSPPSASRSARAFAGQLGVTATSGPGRRPQVGGARPRDQPRAAARAHRRAARRPVDRPAHQDRAVRPPARDVRPPRRVAAADRRRVLAEPLLRRRVRGGAASR